MYVFLVSFQPASRLSRRKRACKDPYDDCVPPFNQDITGQLIITNQHRTEIHFNIVNITVYMLSSVSYTNRHWGILKKIKRLDVLHCNISSRTFQGSQFQNVFLAYFVIQHLLINLKQRLRQRAISVSCAFRINCDFRSFCFRFSKSTFINCAHQTHFVRNLQRGIMQILSLIHIVHRGLCYQLWGLNSQIYSQHGLRGRYLKCAMKFNFD